MGTAVQLRNYFQQAQYVIEIYGPLSFYVVFITVDILDKCKQWVGILIIL